MFWLIISLIDLFLRVSVTCAVGLYVIHLSYLRMPSCVWLIGSKVVGTVVFLGLADSPDDALTTSNGGGSCESQSHATSTGAVVIDAEFHPCKCFGVVGSFHVVSPCSYVFNDLVVHVGHYSAW